MAYRSHVRTADFSDEDFSSSRREQDSRDRSRKRDGRSSRDRSRERNVRSSRDRDRSSDERSRRRDRDKDVRSSRDRHVRSSRDRDRGSDEDVRSSRSSRRARSRSPGFDGDVRSSRSSRVVRSSHGLALSDEDEPVRSSRERSIRSSRATRDRTSSSSATARRKKRRSPSPAPTSASDNDDDEEQSSASESEDDGRRRRRDASSRRTRKAKKKDKKKKKKEKTVKKSSRLMPVRDLRKALIHQKAYTPEEESGSNKKRSKKKKKKKDTEEGEGSGSGSDSDSDSDDDDDGERVLGRLQLGGTVLAQIDDSRAWTVTAVVGWKESGRIVSVQVRNKDTVKDVPVLRVKHLAAELGEGDTLAVMVKPAAAEGSAKKARAAEEEVDATVVELHGDGTVSVDLGDGAAAPTRLTVCKVVPASLAAAKLAVGCIVQYYARDTAEWHLGRVLAVSPPRKKAKKKKAKAGSKAKKKKKKKDDADLYAPRYSVLRLDGEELQRSDRTDVPESALRVVTGDVRSFRAALEECRDGGGTLTEARFADAAKCIFGSAARGLSADAIAEIATRYELSLASLFADVETDAEQHRTAVMFAADSVEAELDEDAAAGGDGDGGGDERAEGGGASESDDKRSGDERRGRRSDDESSEGSDDGARGKSAGARGRRSAAEEAIDAAVRRKFKQQYLALVGDVFDRVDAGDNVVDANKLPQMLALLLIALSEDEINAILSSHTDVVEAECMTRAQFKALATEAFGAAHAKPKEAVSGSAMKQLFDSLDVDHDGSVTFLEWKTAMETEWGMTGMQRELEAMVGLMDTDGDGEVSYVEFVAAIAAIEPATHAKARHSTKSKRGRKSGEKGKKMALSAEWVGEVPRLGADERAQHWLRDNPAAVFGLKRFMMGKIRPISRAVELFKFMPYSMTEATLGKLEGRVGNTWDCALRLPAKSGCTPPETRPVTIEISIKSATNVYYPDGDAKKDGDAFVLGADGDEVVNVARDVVTRVLRVTLIDDPDDVAGIAQRVALKEAPKGDAADGDAGSTATKDDKSTASASATSSSRSRKGQRTTKRVPMFISNQACVAASWKGGAKADTWKFETAEHKMNEILVRCDGVSTSESNACSRVYVCFELCMVVHCRKGLGSSKPSSLKKDDPVMEVSCGWGVIPLFEQDPPPGITAAEFGRSLEGCKDGKALDIPLIAGSPLAPIRIKPASGMQAQKSLWRRAAARVGGSKSVLSIVVNKLGAKKPYTAHAAELPHTLVAPVMALSHITRLRGINKGVRSSAHFDALPYAEPAALIFPDVLSDPFVLMTFLACWEEWVKKAVKVQKSRMKQGASSAEKRELAEHTRLMKGRFQTLAEDTLMPKTQLEGFRECVLRMWPASAYENITARTWGANKASLSTRDAMAGGGGAVEHRQKLLDSCLHRELGDFFGKDKEAGPVAPFHIDELTYNPGQYS